jgi:hypothetical protein
MKKMTGQDMLVGITKDDSYPLRVRIAAAETITYQDLLANIVEDGNYPPEIRVAAAMKLDDQGKVQLLYADFIRTNAYPPYVDYQALSPSPLKIMEKLTDQRLLEHVAKTATSSKISLLAAERLTDTRLQQTIYADMVPDNSALIERITDVDILEGLWAQWKKPSRWQKHGWLEGRVLVDRLGVKLADMFDEESMLLDIVKNAPYEACGKAWDKLRTIGYQSRPCASHDLIVGPSSDHQRSGRVETWTENSLCRKCGEKRQESAYRYIDY